MCPLKVVKSKIGKQKQIRTRCRICLERKTKFKNPVDA
jgi:hypothetical protein